MTGKCEQCGTEFAKSVHWQLYCSKKCGNAAAQKRLRTKAKAWQDYAKRLETKKQEN